MLTNYLRTRKIRSLARQRDREKIRKDKQNANCEHWRNGIRTNSFARLDEQFLKDVAEAKEWTPRWWFHMTRPFRNICRAYWRGRCRRAERGLIHEIQAKWDSDVVDRKAISGYQLDPKDTNKLIPIPAAAWLQDNVDEFYRDYDSRMSENQPL